ncbi:MAG: metallophosphoesterase [Gaiellales bacterium]
MIALPLAGAALVSSAAGVAEALAVTRIDRTVPIRRLPDALDGLRIAHVSDLHLGAPGVNASAARRAAGLVQAAEPDLIAVTGDLLTHPRGHADLLEVLGALAAPLGVFVTLGNHDVGKVRDPFSRVGELPDLAPTGVELLRDRTVALEHGGVTLAVTGLEPHDPDEHPAGLPDGWPAHDADLHLVLAHFPDVFDGAPADAAGLVLSGHLHGGQICLPWPTGRIRFSQLGHPYADGLYQRGDLTMHVSRGVGTTFVPVRLFARPEVTVLTLAAA